MRTDTLPLAGASPGQQLSLKLLRFGQAIDAIRERAEARVGAADLTRVRRLDRFSRVMEVVGRVLIHVSFEPITFVLGVSALWIHKQLQATEIGRSLAQAMRPTYADIVADLRNTGLKPRSLVVRSFFGALDELVTSWILSPTHYNLVDLAEPVTDLFLGGLAPRGART